VNKSLKDPHTNLLRQTTEAMSAIIGGIDRLIIHPHDEQSTQGASELAQRMALNISNLLQDESYLATVNDPLGGSYALEKLTQDLSEKSWELFKTMDQLPTTQKETEWQRLVQDKAKQRIEMIKNSETVLLGINKFPNPQPTNNQWLPAKQFNNLSYLRLETEIQ
jgi:methylmalonyl-CoA mutase